MAEYIDKKALIETIKNAPIYLEMFIHFDRYDGAAWREHEILNIIDAAPTVKVASFNYCPWCGARIDGGTDNETEYIEREALMKGGKA